jgi:nitroreductase
MPEESIKDIIKRRTSWRTYNGKPISEELEKKLHEFTQTKPKTPFGTAPRFEIITKSQPDSQKLSTFGFISCEKNFIVGTTKNQTDAIIDYGYQLENIILYATKLNLGTCWLGSFNRQGFNQVIELNENEIIPAVSSIGYPKQERRLAGKIIRVFAGSTKRKNWDQLFFRNNFSTPLSKHEAGQYFEALEMVRLGPSASNKQPWRVIKENKKLHFYCETNGFSIMQQLDMGIAMCHLELTLKEENIKGKWERVSHQESEKKYIATWVSSLD